MNESGDGGARRFGTAEGAAQHVDAAAMEFAPTGDTGSRR